MMFLFFFLFFYQKKQAFNRDTICKKEREIMKHIYSGFIFFISCLVLEQCPYYALKLPAGSRLYSYFKRDTDFNCLG